jgi:hypothetical protein
LFSSMIVKTSPNLQYAATLHRLDEFESRVDAVRRLVSSVRALRTFTSQGSHFDVTARTHQWVRRTIKLHAAQLKWSIASRPWSASGVHPTRLDEKEHGTAIR